MYTFRCIKKTMLLFSTISEIVQILNKSLLLGILVTSIVSLFQKDKNKIQPLVPIFKYTLLSIACFNVCQILILYLVYRTDTSVFLNRIETNAAYSIMWVGSYILPFILLFKRIAKHIGILLFVSLMMNIGLLFELFIIILANQHSYFPSDSIP